MNSFYETTRSNGKNESSKIEKSSEGRWKATIFKEEIFVHPHNALRNIFFSSIISSGTRSSIGITFSSSESRDAVRLFRSSVTFFRKQPDQYSTSSPGKMYRGYPFLRFSFCMRTKLQRNVTPFGMYIKNKFPYDWSESRRG